MGHLHASRPREAWSLDCAPHLPGTDGNKVSVLIMVDDFSKFVLLKTLPNLQSQTVARVVEADIIWTFGKPS